MSHVFMQGPVCPQTISDLIAKHSAKENIGAQALFLGQVRGDIIQQKKVIGIEYSAYEEMAHKIFHAIREEGFQKFDLVCMHIIHSIGFVKVGEISLFVLVSSRHRQEAFAACAWIVEEIKKRVPVFGKEMLEGSGYQWKENTL